MFDKKVRICAQLSAGAIVGSYTSLRYRLLQKCYDTFKLNNQIAIKGAMHLLAIPGMIQVASKTYSDFEDLVVNLLDLSQIEKVFQLQITN